VNEEICVVYRRLKLITNCDAFRSSCRDVCNRLPFTFLVPGFVAEPGAPAFMVWSARSDTLCPHMYSEKHLRQAIGRNGIRRLSVPQRLYTKGECWKLKLTSLHAHGDVVGRHLNKPQQFPLKALSLHYWLSFPYYPALYTCHSIFKQWFAWN
jgi:hypothetical protein